MYATKNFLKNSAWIKSVVLVGVGILTSGCAESSFLLAHESDVPGVFAIPQDVARDRVSVRLSYYATGKATLRLKIDGKDGVELTGRTINRTPFTDGEEQYPAFEFVDIDGVVICLEHRAMEPRFYSCNRTPDEFYD